MIMQWIQNVSQRDPRVLLIAAVSLFMLFSGCAGVNGSAAPNQLEYHPLLDDQEPIPFEWDEDPEFPPREPLPIIPLEQPES